eukprot:gene11511-4675_t
MSLSHTKLNSIFSNEASEILDYLDDDHKLPYKTFSVEDIFSNDEDLKKVDSAAIKKITRVLGDGLEKKRSETILPRYLQDQDKITVGSPSTEKENLKTYTTYLIKYGNLEVRRRYSEFLTLYQKFTKNFQDKNFPSFPDKKQFGRFDQDFIHDRMVGLQKFLQFCLQDEDLRLSIDFQLFVQK